MRKLILGLFLPFFLLSCTLLSGEEEEVIDLEIYDISIVEQVPGQVVLKGSYDLNDSCYYLHKENIHQRKNTVNISMLAKHSGGVCLTSVFTREHLFLIKPDNPGQSYSEIVVNFMKGKEITQSVPISYGELYDN